MSSEGFETTAAAAPASAVGLDDGRPQKLGRYQVGARLGAGGMGVVYAAHDPNLDRPVAIKVVSPSLARKPEAASRLLREAKAMAKVSHRSVVAIYDAGEADGQLYLAMELVEGTTLGRLMRERAHAHDWEKWLAMMIAAGRGLAAAHAAGITHRDFKPDNVLVGRDGRVCVADFGVASVTREHVSSSDSASLTLELTSHGSLIGTPAYMSPEQLMSDPADARSDQFSFCVALYEALYGKRPFDVPPEAEPLSGLLEAIEAGRIRAAPKDSLVPRRIRDLVIRGIAAKPENRWPDIATLLDALAPRRKPWRYLAAAVAVVAVGGAIGFTATRSHSPVEHHWIPKPMFPVAIRSALALAPDGKSLSLTVFGHASVYDLAGAKLGDIDAPAGKNILGAAFVDADHMMLGFGDSDPNRGEVVAWNFRTQQQTPAGALPMAWTFIGVVDNGWLVRRLRDQTFELGVMPPPPVGLAAEQVPEPHIIASSPLELTPYAISPDRKHIAFGISSTYASELVVIDSAGKEVAHSEPIVELTAICWRSPEELVVSIGAGEHPRLVAMPIAEPRLAKRTTLFEADKGWFGHVMATGDGLYYIDTHTKFRARKLGASSVEELDPELVGAAMVWTADGHYLLWNRSKRELRVDGDPTPIAAEVGGEPANSTRAGDVAIVAMRRPGGRELTAVSLKQHSLLWKKDIGYASLVRCAGDAAPPCVAVVQEPQQERVVRIDPLTGTLGEQLYAVDHETIQDVAVAPGGDEITICSHGTLRAMSLTTHVMRDVTAKIDAQRAVAYDPRGGLIVSGTDHGRYSLWRFVEGQDPTRLLVSDGDLMFQPRPSPDGQTILVMGRQFAPELVQLVER